MSIRKRLLGIPDREAPNPIPFHLTILHIGAVDRLIRSIQPRSPFGEDEILMRINTFSNRLAELAAQYQKVDFSLEAIGLSLFGERKSTLVILYSNFSETLSAIHQDGYILLNDLLKDCHILDPLECIKNDRNLKFCMTFNPHVTIAKKYNGSVGSIDTQPMNFRLMPVIYE